LGGGELEAIDDPAYYVGSDRLDGDSELLLRAGKKRFCRVVALK